MTNTQHTVYTQICTMIMIGTTTSQWNTHSLTRALYSHNTHIASAPLAPVSNTEPEPKHSTVYTTLNCGGVGREGRAARPPPMLFPLTHGTTITQSQSPTRHGQVVSFKLFLSTIFCRLHRPTFFKMPIHSFILSHTPSKLPWKADTNLNNRGQINLRP